MVLGPFGLRVLEWGFEDLGILGLQEEDVGSLQRLLGFGGQFRA